MSHPTTSVSVVNRQFKLAAVPSGMPKESDFRMVSELRPEPADSQFLIKTAFWSVDPYMRGRITGIKTYADPVLVGDLMQGGTVGEIVESKNPHFAVGDFVVGMWGWQEYAVSDGKGVQKLNPRLAPVSTALGVLGMPGMTAYFGFLEICQPKPGDTVVVSGAAGAVGSLVSQIAKIKGCHVVGIAGADDKVEFLVNELGCDAAFNYKTCSNYVTKLKELCPNGIDCYFDNVGGAITDAVFPSVESLRARLDMRADLAIQSRQTGTWPSSLTYILVKQVRVEGFIVIRWMNRWGEGIAQMAQWLSEGKIKYREDVVTGFENIPTAFIEMLNGKNTGKMLIRA